MRARTTTSIGKKVTTALLALAMALGVAPGAALAEEVELGPQSDGKAVACLGTSRSVARNDGKDQFSGSYVYYGTYDDTPTKYRVLANGMTDFTGEGKPTMLLDCDAIPILRQRYAEDSNVWSNSAVKKVLVTNENSFFKVALTAQEQGAVAPSTKAASGNDFALEGDTAFVLSAGEASG